MDNDKFKEYMSKRRQDMARYGKTTKLKPGKNRIHLLPGWRAGEEHIWDHSFGQHFIKDTPNGKPLAVYVCNEVTFKKPCNVCKAMAQANRHVHDDATQELLADASASEIVLCNALMLDSTTPFTPVILELKKSVYEQIDGMFEQYGAELFFDLNKGHEIIVNREGTALLTKYTAMPSIQPGVAIPAAVLTQLHDLDKYVAQHSDEKERKAIAAVNTVAGIGAPVAHVPSQPLQAAIAAPAAPIGMPVGLGGHAQPVMAEPQLDDSLDDLLSDIPA